jgi:fused signal recognition particle receptor
MRWFRRKKSDEGGSTPTQPDVDAAAERRADVAPLRLRRRRRCGRDAGATPADSPNPCDVATDPRCEPASPNPSSSRHAPPPASPGKPGWRERLRGSAFAKSFGGLFSRHPKLDDDLLDEIETALLTADVGVAATTQLLEGLRQRMKRREFATPATCCAHCATN